MDLINNEHVKSPSRKQVRASVVCNACRQIKCEVSCHVTINMSLDLINWQQDPVQQVQFSV
jgi:hypothetical protein